MEINLRSALNFILTLCFSLSVQAGNQLPACPVSSIDLGRMGPPPLFGNGGGSIFNIFEQKDGVGRFFTLPQTPADVYFGDSEFSFEKIQSYINESNKFWSKPPEKYPEYWNNIQFDWESFARLNQQADQVWNKMLECNFHRTSEVRKNFFLGNPCANESASKELIQDLTELNTNIYTFLATSPLINIKADWQTQSQTLNKAEVPKIPHQHPLLQQMLMTFSAMVTSLAIAKEEPASNAVGYYDHMVGYFSEPEIVPEHVKKYYTPLPRIEMSTTVKMIVNLTAILASPLDSCDQFGLWPAMNRVFHQFKGYTYNNIYSPIKELDEHTLRMSEKLCGTEINPTRREGSTYARFFTLHDYNMKRLFASYFPQNFENSDRKKIIKNTRFLLEKDSLYCH